MRRRRDRSFEIKTPAQLALMREAGLVVAAALSAAARAVEPGISTAELDAIAERDHPRRRAPSRPLRAITASPPRSAPRSTTRSCTASRAAEVRLAAGDLISIDCGAIVDGWHGDAAVTVGVGPVTPAPSGLLDDLRAGPVAGPEPRAWPAAGCPTSAHAVEAAASAARRVRDRRGLRRARHRQPDAHGPAGAQLRPAGPGPAAGRGDGPGRRADARAGRPGDAAAGRRLDRGHRGRQPGGALRAHGGDHRGRALGADRARTAGPAAWRRPAPAGRRSAARAGQARAHARAAAGATGNSGGS